MAAAVMGHEGSRKAMYHGCETSSSDRRSLQSGQGNAPIDRLLQQHTGEKDMPSTVARLSYAQLLSSVSRVQTLVLN